MKLSVSYVIDRDAGVVRWIGPAKVAREYVKVNGGELVTLHVTAASTAEAVAAVAVRAVQLAADLGPNGTVLVWSNPGSWVESVAGGGKKGGALHFISSPSA